MSKLQLPSLFRPWGLSLLPAQYLRYRICQLLSSSHLTHLNSLLLTKTNATAFWLASLQISTLQSPPKLWEFF